MMIQRSGISKSNGKCQSNPLLRWISSEKLREAETEKKKKWSRNEKEREINIIFLFFFSLQRIQSCQTRLLNAEIKRCMVQ